MAYACLMEVGRAYTCHVKIMIFFSETIKGIILQIVIRIIEIIPNKLQENL